MSNKRCKVARDVALERTDVLKDMLVKVICGDLVPIVYEYIGCLECWIRGQYVSCSTKLVYIDLEEALYCWSHASSLDFAKYSSYTCAHCLSLDMLISARCLKCSHIVCMQCFKKSSS